MQHKHDSSWSELTGIVKKNFTLTVSLKGESSLFTEDGGIERTIGICPYLHEQALTFRKIFKQLPAIGSELTYMDYDMTYVVMNCIFTQIHYPNGGSDNHVEIIVRERLPGGE